MSTPSERVKRITDEAVGFEFLPSIKERNTLSEKQENVLRGIEKRIFEEED